MGRLIRRSVVLLIALAGAGPAAASTLCVNPGGTGGCFASIQAAVNAAADDDLIDVAAGTYAENVVIPAQRRLAIQGAGIGATVIDGGGAGATVTANDRAELALSGVTATNGTLGVDSIRGDVQIAQSEISNNATGGIFQHPGYLSKAGGHLTVTSGSVVGNGGIGIQTYQAIVTIDGTSIGSNTDHGIFLQRSTATIESSQIVGNGGVGLGVYQGRYTVLRSTISQNAYGGLSVDRAPASLIETTISDNIAAAPAGAANLYKASLRLTNCTLSGNQGNQAGAINNFKSHAVLKSTTVASNTAVSGAGGVYEFYGGTTTAFNSIFADNAGVEGDCSGRFRSGGYNLIEDATYCEHSGSNTV